MYHNLGRWVTRWPNVVPGDSVVSPGTLAVHLRDFPNRDLQTRCLTLAKSPLLVVSKLSNNECDEVDPTEELFIVLSRHGLLCVVMLK